MYRGRLAPTPSGFLHLGHARTFWVAARRAASGELLLRHDDLDRARCKPEYLEAAEDDLRWLGLSWSPPVYRQSQRLHLYEEAFQQLLQSGMAYPCSCSRKDIAEAVRAPHQEEPLYPGFCLEGPSEGRPILCYRLRTKPGDEVEFEDGACGPQRFVAGRDFGDFVLWRPGTGPSYQLACAVDDALMRITEVVRGADLLTSTARQILILRALGYESPAYFHCDLVTDEQGVRLAKRHDALALQELRRQGRTPAELHKTVTS